MLEEELEERCALISGAIGHYLPLVSPIGLYEASRHLVDAGGKRLRPTMLLLATEAVGGNPSAVLPAAISIELVHNFTLIHDDIMDNSDVRRGRAAVHVLWGVSGAILAGDTLYSKAFQILGMSQADPQRILSSMDMLSKTCTSICEGQWLDIDFEKRDNVREEEYMVMIEKKTGVLFGASAWIGGALFGATLAERNGLEKFGRLVGMGFQIHDDVLDLTAPVEVLGKPRGGDLLEGKKTLIMIHAMEHGIQLPIFGQGRADLDEIERALALLNESGSIAYAQNRARYLVEQGKEALSTLGDSHAKRLLLELADYMISRRY